MSTDNNIKKFSAADIEKYHQGLLSVKERHDLEKAALEDPFLADALEGYAVADVNRTADLADLKKRLAERTGANKAVPMGGSRKTFAPFLRVAAMIVLVAGAGMLVYQFAFNKKDDTVAEVKQVPIEKEKNTVTPVGTDTTPVTIDTEKSTQGLAATETTKEKVKATADGPGTAGKDSKLADETESTIAKGETKVDEKSVVSSDVKTPPSGGAPVSGTIVSPRAPAVNDQPDRSAGNGADKDFAAREETKTRSLAKKQEAAKEGARNQAVQQPDDSKNTRGIVNYQKNDDAYYRNQAMNTFRGRVTDASNVGLPFANVTNTRDNVGTYTDANGNFVLTSTDSVLNVQIRSLGYDNNNTQLRNDIASHKVVMQEDRQNLSEVVVSNQKPNAAARSMNGNRKLIEPEPVDGWVKYDSYLANNLNLPEDYKPQQETNTNYVQVSFEVDKNGEPVSIRIERSLCPSCDEEAKRLVKEGPRFKRNANKKGRTTVTINF